MFTSCARRTLSNVVGCHVLLLALAGCASAAAGVNTSRATAAVERARKAGASGASPYEMTLAEAYLDMAREEASRAQYVDAIRYAKNAREQAEKAVELQRQQRSGSSR